MAVALFPGARRGLLGLLYGQPDSAFYLREIAARVGAGMGQVQRELERLSKAGILHRFEKGRHVYYQANRHCPVYDELRGLVVKTVAGPDLLRHALTELADRIEVAFVFGSVARGENRAESDLDLFVAERENKHQRTLECLEYTVGVERKRVLFLDTCRRKRHKAIYERVGAVSDGEANEMIAAATQLRREVKGWICEERPDLLDI